ASAEADALSGGLSVSARGLYDLACVFALCSTAAAKDANAPSADRAALEENYAARAVALLSRAHEKGYLRQRAEVEWMRKDTDLDPLRARADYRKLLAEVEKDQRRD